MIGGDARDFDLIEALAENRGALKQKTAERKQVAAIVGHCVVCGARRLFQRRRKCVYLGLHRLARTHLSGYAISGDSAEKARIFGAGRIPVPRGTMPHEQLAASL